MPLVRGSSPIWSLVDLSGKQLDDTYYMFVLLNTLPYIPATVWQDPNGNVEWTNPIRFLANGTLPINIYWNTSQIYRLEIRQGDSQQDPLIYVVENYVPATSGSGPIPPVEAPIITDNLITNPQFAQVNFNSPLNLTSISTQSLEIAPGWHLDLIGSGNLGLIQKPLNSTDINPGNAPYVLNIVLSGLWTSVKLRQRFEQNGMLFTNNNLSTLYVSNSITGYITPNPNNLKTSLVDSNGITLTEIINVTFDSGWNEYIDVNKCTATTNPDLPPAAYVDYFVTLPVTGSIFITSIQLIASDTNAAFNYQQVPVNREIDHTFNYWQEWLDIKPIPSFLVGWDFTLNPAQWGLSLSFLTTGGANNAFYAWDQTVIFQSTDASINVNPSSSHEALVLQAVQNTQFAIVQYLDGDTALDLLLSGYLNELCSNIRMFASSDTTLTVSLWWSTTPPPAMTTFLGSNTGYAYGKCFINALDAVGHPSSVTGDWAEIPNMFGNQTFLSKASTNYTSYPFIGWGPLLAYQTAKYFAIVVGTQPIVAGTKLSFNSISLQPGRIPTIPASQSLDEVLRECRYYYESSYPLSLPPGSGVPFNYKTITQNSAAPFTVGNTAATMGSPFGFDYLYKRANPKITLYDPNGTINQVQADLYYAHTGDLIVKHATVQHRNPASFWQNPVISTDRVSYFPVFGSAATYLASATDASNNGSLYSSGSISFHYTADARINVVT